MTSQSISDFEAYFNACQKLESVKQVLKACESEVEGCKGKLLIDLGDADIGKIEMNGDNYRIERTVKTSNRFNTSKFRKEHKSLADQYTTTATSESVKIYKTKNP